MKIKEVLWGIAIGDAFGAGIEFQDRDWIRANVDFSKFVNMRDVPGENYQPWEYTDDTEMSIGLINTLLSGKDFSEDLLVEYWIKEYEADKAAKGYGRSGHGSMRWVYGGEKSIEEIREFQKHREFPGNAPPMRAIPLGFLPENLIDQYAIINADATHPHPKARAASVIVARATYYTLVQKGDLKNIISYCMPFIEQVDKVTAGLLAQVNQLASPEELDEQGFELLCGPQPLAWKRPIIGLGSDSMRTGLCVLYILKHANNAMEGFKNAIYMGGDVDSLASICLGILAGKFGLDSVPAFMLENVEGKDKLESLAGDFEEYLK